ncbi:phenylacetate--CoA ligase family protein [Vulcanimicrobium alpinum]
MEAWSFPPRIDASYIPPNDQRYWHPVRETMPPDERDAAIAVRLREVMRHAYKSSAFYKKKWDDAGIDPESIRSLEDFERVPVVTKAELRASQAAHEPYGDYLCVPESEIHHIHGTSGTTGKPTAFAIGRNDWQTIGENHARILWGMGFRPGDTIFFGAIFSLYLGSWGAMSGAERMKARSFPFGAGAQGMTARAAQWLAMVKPAGFYGTPSYALRLAEVAREEGYDPRAFGLRTLFFSGEPGASIPSVRDRIENEFGARVIDTGTMAEMTPFMSAAGSAESHEGMLLWQDMVYHEVCDPATYARVPYGEQGTPVYTHLERTSQPMIRLLSNDLTHWVMEENPCGRTYPRLPKGVHGRIDDMFQIRGENVYPSEIDNVCNAIAGYGGEHRIHISRAQTMDELLVRAEYDATVAAGGDAAIAAFRRTLGDQLRKVLGVGANVEPVPPNTYERTDFKARRVVDDRDLYGQVYQSTHPH